MVIAEREGIINANKFIIGKEFHPINGNIILGNHGQGNDTIAQEGERLPIFPCRKGESGGGIVYRHLNDERPKTPKPLGRIAEI